MHGLPENESFTHYSFILKEKRKILPKLKLKLYSKDCSLSWRDLIKLTREITDPDYDPT
jgi:hypothetical protein